MYINEVCKECNLTKKAVEYYEKQRLIQPRTSENGYRIYTEQDVARLKEIAVLRKLDIGTSDIRIILESRNKTAALSKSIYLKELKLQKTAAQKKGIEALIRNYDITEATEYVRKEIDPFLTMKEKLVQSFPGNFGMHLSIHFGRFLNGTIDGPEQEEAYRNCIAYLDTLDEIEIPEDLKAYVEETFSLLKGSDMKQISDQMADAIEDMETFIEKKDEFIQTYLKMRGSDEFRQTDAYRYGQQLRKTLQKSGYERIFLSNLKILSPEYRTYTEKLNAAMRSFCENTRKRRK